MGVPGTPATKRIPSADRNSTTRSAPLRLDLVVWLLAAGVGMTLLATYALGFQVANPRPVMPWRRGM